jgi:hypothetical protein
MHRGAARGRTQAQAHSAQGRLEFAFDALNAAAALRVC